MIWISAVRNGPMAVAPNPAISRARAFITMLLFTLSQVECRRSERSTPSIVLRLHDVASVQPFAESP